MRRPGPPRDIPPPLELECLKVLWVIGKGSVGEVRAELKLQHRELAYTTVMTLMDRLERRGAVSRRKSGRMFIYEPVLTRDVLRRMAVKELAETLFDGSVEALVEYLRDEGLKRGD